MLEQADVHHDMLLMSAFLAPASEFAAGFQAREMVWSMYRDHCALFLRDRSKTIDGMVGENHWGVSCFAVQLFREQGGCVLR